MRISVLGGTSFVGRHLVEAALARGHDVTLFNRGVTDPELFAGRTRLVRGNRDVATDVARLVEIEADAVLDVSGYTPDAVRASALAIRPRAMRS